MAACYAVMSALGGIVSAKNAPREISSNHAVARSDAGDGASSGLPPVPKLELERGGAVDEEHGIAFPERKSSERKAVSIFRNKMQFKY